MVRLWNTPAMSSMAMPPGRVCICAKNSSSTCHTTAEAIISRGSRSLTPMRLMSTPPSMAPKEMLAIR